MSRTHRSILAILMALGLSAALLLFVNGCGNNDEAGTNQSSQTMNPSDEMMGQTDGMMDMDHDQMAANANAAALAGIEQKTCPVMEGNPIDPNIFVEYQGKKVYFCCQACPAKFEADPDKYLSKLPQFQQ